MSKKKSEPRSANLILIEMLMKNVGMISVLIEKRGGEVFGQKNLLSKDEIDDYSLEFLELFTLLLHTGEKVDRRGVEFKALRQFFTTLSQQIVLRGGNQDDFIRYVQFMEHVFMENLKTDESLSVDDLRASLLLLGEVFNDIILDVFHVYLEGKEQVIQEQQEELRLVSTPITEIWDSVLTLPIIGSLDSSRTMMVMDKLLNRIESDRARVVVIDVTGVLAIDTQVSHHLVQMIHAITLMGAAAVLTGIRPEIARALASLNINLGDVTTRATLSEGLKEAFRRLNIEVVTHQ